LPDALAAAGRICENAHMSSKDHPSQSPRIGLVLGSGGARGMAHIGALQRLHDWGLRPYCVVGTSAGALVGAAYAAGRLEEMARHVRELDWRRTAQLFMEVNFSRSGLIYGRHIETLLREIYGLSEIGAMPLRFAAVATDLVREEEVVLDRGDLLEAIRASIAIPGIFTPVRHDGRFLVDGGLLNPLPVSVARAMGAERVLAIEVNLRDHAVSIHEPVAPEPRRQKRMNIIDVLTKTLRIVENQVVRQRLLVEPPDLLLQPSVGNILTLEFHKSASIIAAGAAVVEERLDEIRRFLGACGK
jgi:NTE family protein